MNQRFTKFETTTESKLNKYQQQISSDITKLEQQLTELNKSLKTTKLLAIVAIAAGIIAAIFAVFPFLSKTTNEVESRNFEIPRISQQNIL